MAKIVNFPTADPPSDTEPKVQDISAVAPKVTYGQTEVSRVELKALQAFQGALSGMIRAFGPQGAVTHCEAEIAAFKRSVETDKTD